MHTLFSLQVLHKTSCELDPAEQVRLINICKLPQQVHARDNAEFFAEEGMSCFEAYPSWVRGGHVDEDEAIEGNPNPVNIHDTSIEAIQ